MCIYIYICVCVCVYLYRVYRVYTHSLSLSLSLQFYSVTLNSSRDVALIKPTNSSGNMRSYDKSLNQ